MASDLGLVRVQRETVQERIYLALRAKLMRGGFRPGQGLKLLELANAFGTSAMPVREALNRLAAERGLEALPNRTICVPALTVSQLHDLREARCAIESLAVERAAESMDKTTIAALAAAVQAQHRADLENRLEDSAEQNQRFHFLIYQQAQSSVLLGIIESLWLQSGPALRFASDRFDRRNNDGTEFHTAIVKALRRGDGSAAREALSADIARSFDLAVESAADWVRQKERRVGG